MTPCSGAMIVVWRVVVSGAKNLQSTIFVIKKVPNAHSDKKTCKSVLFLSPSLSLSRFCMAVWVDVPTVRGVRARGCVRVCECP